MLSKSGMDADFSDALAVACVKKTPACIDAPCSFLSMEGLWISSCYSYLANPNHCCNLDDSSMRKGEATSPTLPFRSEQLEAHNFSWQDLPNMDDPISQVGPHLTRIMAKSLLVGTPAFDMCGLPLAGVDSLRVSQSPR